MTILTDIDFAISVELDKQRHGKRPKRMRLVLGDAAAREFNRQYCSLPPSYKGAVIEGTDLYEGWELIC